MKGLLLKSSGEITVQEFEQPLIDSLHSAVGGFVEVVTCRHLLCDYRLVVNDEFLIYDLPFNQAASYLYGFSQHGNPILGDAVIMRMGMICGEPDLTGLDVDDILFLHQCLNIFVA